MGKIGAACVKMTAGTTRLIDSGYCCPSRQVINDTAISEMNIDILPLENAL